MDQPGCILKPRKLIYQTQEGPFVEQTWQFEAPEVQWALDYWMGLRGNRQCPCWSEIDLFSYYKYARLMTIKDAINSGEDFLVRFWGTGIVDVLKYDASGKKLSEYYPAPYSAEMIEQHRLALLGDMPIRRWGNSLFPNREYIKYEIIQLPLSNDMGERAHVLTLTAFS